MGPKNDEMRSKKVTIWGFKKADFDSGRKGRLYICRKVVKNRGLSFSEFFQGFVRKACAQEIFYGLKWHTCFCDISRFFDDFMGESMRLGSKNVIKKTQILRIMSFLCLFVSFSEKIYQNLSRSAQKVVKNDPRFLF